MISLFRTEDVRPAEISNQVSVFGRRVWHLHWGSLLCGLYHSERGHSVYLWIALPRCRFPALITALLTLWALALSTSRFPFAFGCSRAGKHAGQFNSTSFIFFVCSGSILFLQLISSRLLSRFRHRVLRTYTPPPVSLLAGFLWNNAACQRLRLRGNVACLSGAWRQELRGQLQFSPGSGAFFKG